MLVYIFPNSPTLLLWGGKPENNCCFPKILPPDSDENNPPCVGCPLVKKLGVFFGEELKREGPLANYPNRFGFYGIKKNDVVVGTSIFLPPGPIAVNVTYFFKTYEMGFVTYEESLF